MMGVVHRTVTLNLPNEFITTEPLYRAIRPDRLPIFQPVQSHNHCDLQYKLI